MNYFLTTLLSLLFLASANAANETSVGINIKVDGIEITGEKVQPIPRMDSSAPIVIRISNSEKTDAGYVYDFRVEGYEPGDYNLCDFLQRLSGKPLGEDVEAIPFHVDSVLEPDVMDVEPPAIIEPERIGGYKLLLKVFAGLWLLIPIIYLIMKQKKSSQEVDEKLPPTLADRIAPMVQQAADGTLSTDDRAKLERMVLGHWMEKKPALRNLTTAEAIKQLRADDEASPLLLALEKWLHSPSPSEYAEISDLLAPYAERGES